MASPHRATRIASLVLLTAAAVALAAEQPPAAVKPGLKASDRPKSEGQPQAKSPKDDSKPIVIRGRVVDHQGRAVPKAEVWLPLRSNPASMAHGHADERGEYQLTIPRERRPVAVRWTILAHAKGHALGTASARTILFDGSNDRVDVKLGAASRASVVVLDPEGKPVAGATVNPRISYDRIDATLAAATDEAGRARLPGAAAVDLHNVRVVAKEFGTQDHGLGIPEGQHEGTIRLKPVGRVEGQVFAENRELLRGLKFRLKSSARHGEGVAVVECDADGKFVVPRIAVGELKVSGLVESRRPLRLRPRFDSEVIPGETVTLEMDLVPGVLVRGRVQLAESGKPLSGEEVLFIFADRQSDQVETDAEGWFEARVLPGDVHTAVYLPQDRQLFQRSGASASVPEGVAKFDWPVIQLAKTVRHEGRLIDKDGKPVAGATIFGSRGYGNCTTDRDGKFSIVLRPDNESFSVRLDGAFYEPMLEKTDPLLLKLPVAIK